jgi:hypothetical protein
MCFVRCMVDRDRSLVVSYMTASWLVILRPRARSTLAPRASLFRLFDFSSVGTKAASDRTNGTLPTGDPRIADMYHLHDGFERLESNVLASHSPAQSALDLSPKSEFVQVVRLLLCGDKPLLVEVSGSPSLAASDRTNGTLPTGDPRIADMYHLHDGFEFRFCNNL